MMQQNAAHFHTGAPTRPQIDTVAPLPRLAGDRSAWLQAVHWVHSAGVAPLPKHGPKFGETTVRLAELIADLTPCRPTVAYLMRMLKASERTVQYHLRHLERTGLLAPLSGGTRLPRSEETGGRVISLASEWERTIPAAFDEALGIRTVGEGREQRPVGIAKHGRKLIAKLAKKATRKTRRKPSKKATAVRARCTPMEGGSVTASPQVVTTSVPLEGEAKRDTRKGNKVQRRWGMAMELIRRVPWLGRANPDRVAWVVRHVSDADWTVDEVEAWLHLEAAPQQVRRPSGFLAARIRAAHLIWTTPAARQEGLEQTRGTRVARQERHADYGDEWQAPSDSCVVVSLMAGLQEGQARLSADLRTKGLDDLSGYIPTQAQPADDWDVMVASLVATIGEEARTVLEGARA